MNIKISRLRIPAYTPLFLAIMTACGNVNANPAVEGGEDCGCGEIGNKVWFDSNKDGIQDLIESVDTGVPNVTLTLSSCNGSAINETYTTKKDGYYVFSGLLAGSYKVTAEIDATYAFTKPRAGNDTSNDSDIVNINGNMGSTECITLNANESNLNVDIGLTKPALNLGSIGDTVYHDANEDTFQDRNEEGVPNATVTLFNGWSIEIAKTTTDSNGHYSFKNLAIHEKDNTSIGCYKTEVTRPSTGQFASAYITTDALTWSCLTVNENENDVNHDYGLKGNGTGSINNGSIGDRFWHDSNSDGIQDAGEQGIPDATLYLYDKNQNFVKEVQTDANGNYAFHNLDVGCYYVDAYPPETGKFSTATFTTGSWIQACISENEQKNIIDFGVNVSSTPPPVHKLATILGTVWTDQNADKIQNPREKGIASAHVILYDSLTSKRITSVLTNANGNYNFPDLKSGCYTIKTTGTTSKSFTTPSQYNVCVNNDETITRNFGLRKLGVPIHYCNANPRNFSLVVRENSWNFYDSYALYDQNNKFLLNTRVIKSNVDGERAGVPRPAVNRFHLGTYMRYWVEESLKLHDPDPSHARAIRNVRSIVGVRNNGERSPMLRCERERYTPVALDLNGDGKIGVTGASTARDAKGNKLGKTVKFDMFGDNQAVEMEWFAGDGDGILIDNRDGLAETQMNGTRLFGDQGGQYENGYEQMAEFDTNGDSLLTGTELNGLALWVDNGDAVVQAGELRSLSDYNIISISTKMGMNAKGLMRSSAKTAAGRIIMTEDVWFSLK